MSVATEPHVGASAASRAGDAARRGRGGRLLAGLPLVLALVVWALSLRAIDVTGLGKLGLPPELPLGWYLSFSVLVLGGTMACWHSRSSPWLTAAYVLGLVVVVYATVPLVSDAPHYPWVYKHIGVSRFIEAGGGIDSSVDIYNRWPGLFALGAGFAEWAGLDPLRYAAWAEPAFATAKVLLVAAVAYTVSRDRRVAGYSALLFAVGNWIGQSYFAPQPVAWIMGLTVVLLLMRQFATGDVNAFVGRVTARVFKAGQSVTPLSERLPWRDGWVVAGILVINSAVVVTHQLTPYLLLLQLGALAVVGALRSRWVLVAMGVTTVAYLVPQFDYVQKNFGFFSGANPGQNIKTDSATLAGLSFFNRHAGGILSAFLILLMLGAAMRLARLGRARLAVPIVILGLAPFAMLFGNNYGGEASLRIFLFSSPWRDMAVALAIATLAAARVRMVAALGVSAVIATLFVPAFYGGEHVRHIPESEVDAAEHFYANAPAGSVLMLAAPQFPMKVGARYPVMRGPEAADDRPNIVGEKEFQERPLGIADVPAVIGAMRQFSRRAGFLVFATTGLGFARFYNIAPPGELERLERVVARSPRFTLWYRNDDTRIYRVALGRGLSELERAVDGIPRCDRRERTVCATRSAIIFPGSLQAPPRIPGLDVRMQSATLREARSASGRRRDRVRVTVRVRLTIRNTASKDVTIDDGRAMYLSIGGRRVVAERAVRNAFRRAMAPGETRSGELRFELGRFAASALRRQGVTQLGIRAPSALNPNSVDRIGVVRFPTPIAEPALDRPVRKCRVGVEARVCSTRSAVLTMGDAETPISFGGLRVEFASASLLEAMTPSGRARNRVRVTVGLRVRNGSRRKVTVNAGGRGLYLSLRGRRHYVDGSAPDPFRAPLAPGETRAGEIRFELGGDATAAFRNSPRAELGVLLPGVLNARVEPRVGVLQFAAPRA